MKFDKKLPDITGSVGFVIANTFVALSTYDPQDYPMTLIRINLLVYETNRRMRSKHGRVCFHEPFIALYLDDRLMPVLPSVTALYGSEEPSLISNSKGFAVVVHIKDRNDTGDIIAELYRETKSLSDDELFEYLKKNNLTLNNLQQGRVIAI